MHTARARCPAHRWCPPSSSTRQAVTRSTLPKPTVRTILTTNTTSRCAAASAPRHTRCSPHRPSSLPSATLDALPSAPHLLQVLGDRAALVRPQLRRRARAEWRRWRRVSSRILGVHVRGTDKTVAPRVAQRGQSNSLGTGWPSPAPALSRGLGGDGSGQHARYSQRERGRDRSTGRAQSLPRVLQRVASRVTDSPVPGH